ncbi:MAG: 16S rRNA (uracil(1498)-N(3))-methyltransferase [Pseudomonadales bacterium]|nr:16S rRNA (uracil(1498)-N(3))-methyltransferase [Pseudomonadales bacterium]
MNLLLIEKSQILPTDPTDSLLKAKIEGRQLQHLLTIHKAQQGDTLKVGLKNGQTGTGRIEHLSNAEAILTVTLTDEPPDALPVKLIIGLPRPKMLKRIIQHASAMGVKEIHFINSFKVEKSFWSSPWLGTEKLEENLILGLEQAEDTRMPQIYLHKLFKPFVEDKLPEISANTQKWVAHPRVDSACPVATTQPTTLVIGPEGGFTEYEVGKFEEQGFSTFHMGSRILRVETAIPALLAKLFPFA